VNQNYATVSTAGTLATITATAYDQYGDGIAGVEATFRSVTTVNAALTAAAAGAATARGTLFTGSDGTASLSAVVCDAASVGLSGTVAWEINDPGANANEMDTVASSTAAAGVVEGTTITCAKAGTDTMTLTSMNMDVTVANEIQTITTSNTDDTGDFTCTYDGQTTAVQAAAETAGNLQADLRALSNLGDVTVALAGEVYTVTFVANTGDHPQIICTGDNAGGTNLSDGGADTTFAHATTTAGAYGTTFDFVDNNTADDSLITIRTVLNHTAAGAPVVETSYNRWVYDSTDVFEIQGTPGIPGATEAQWETELATKTNASSSMMITYRTGALTTGISAMTIVDAAGG
jgi:hypothetical protein